MKFDLYQDKKKDWRWRVMADNGRVVADSAEGYKRVSAAVNGALVARIGITNYLQGITADESSVPAPEK